MNRLKRPDFDSGAVPEALQKHIENVSLATHYDDLKGGAHDPLTFDPFTLNGSTRALIRGLDWSIPMSLNLIHFICFAPPECAFINTIPTTDDSLQEQTLNQRTLDRTTEP